jgi:hypothetical protein
MYSIGIILFELLRPFRTDMQRQIDIHELKKHYKFPDGMDQHFDKHVSLV